MKKTLFCLLILIPAILIAADGTEKRIRYFSPNNDGVQDAFEVPLKISDRRYVTAWQMIILDENNNVIRTIGNKVALPHKLTFKGFFKQLASKKKGVDVPEKVVWNGAMDNGETAPDGKYFYYFTATDDNGNTSETEKFPVVIDTVPPMIALTQPRDKIFGEGAKAELRISQTGSSEDEWLGVIKNASGETIKNFKWTDSEPQDFRWNGTDNEGHFVRDGVYSYEIAAVDRAGNKSESAVISNIIYSAEKPVPNIMIVGSKYFSPNTESKLLNVEFLLMIPVPEATSGNKLSKWEVKIVDEKGKAYKVFNEKKQELPPQGFVFDGKDDNGVLVPQGRYSATVASSYLNGYESAIIRSPEFVMDTTKPNATLTVSDKIFGAGSKTQTRISIASDSSKKFAPIPAWKGRIYNVASPTESVKEFNFGGYLPEAVDWNGFMSNGRLAPDGKYKFELTAKDLAGNEATIPTNDTFELNTKEAKLLLSMNYAAFSPNANKVKDTITFTPVLKDADVSDWSLTIKNAKGEAVKTIKNVAKLPENFVWDGKNEKGIVCEDGSYNATLLVTSTNGSTATSSTPAFTIDTKQPFLTATCPWSFFSPDGDSNQDTLPVNVASCTSEPEWKAEVLDASGKAVKTYTWKDKIRTNGKDGFAWDGTDEAGNKAKDGNYSIVISSADDAGNSFSTKIAGITLDKRETKAFVTAEYDGISPNGDGAFDTQLFTITTTVKDGISGWSFDIRSENGEAVRSWSDKDGGLPETVKWDGLSKDGKACEGVFTGTLNISYKKGNKVNVASSPFISTATPPQLAVQTSPKYFSPDNDGNDDDLSIKLSGKSLVPFKSWSFVINDPKGKTFWTTKGKSTITEKIIWDGLSNTQKDAKGKAERVQSAMDYPYEFTVTDTLGMTSKVKGVIPIDVLVIRDGNLLKMAVPSIIFRSDNADFKTIDEVKNGLDPAVAKNNEKVLNRVAEILNKFKEYKVKIVGHANRVTDNELEETEDNMQEWGPALIPLSAKRAEFVQGYLMKRGVSAAKLSTEGKGGTELVVNYKDKDNNWKNRRVEFVLEK